jgi:hemolysin activation/secretion protein
MDKYPIYWSRKDEIMTSNKLLRSKRGLNLMLLAFFLCPTPTIFAAPQPVIPAPPTDAGQINKSIDEQRITAPAKNNVSIEVSKEQQQGSEQAQGPKVSVKAFRITGQSIYSPEVLQELVKAETGKELTFAELQGIAKRIADYFNKQGYLVASAYLPAQDIKEGLVEIVVVPGQYGNIDIRNHSRLLPKTASNLLSAIKVGDYVKKDVLERTLLLMTDTSGVSIKATLAPGTTTGTTNLIIDITDTEAVTGTFSMDNYGNKSTGQNASNVTIVLNNVSGSGDAVNIGDNYTGGGMNNASFSYTSLVGNNGLRLGVSYSDMHYTIGKEFAYLKYSGKSKTASIFGIYPLVRSRESNLNAEIQFNSRKLTDSMGLYGLLLDDKQDNAWSVGLNGNSQDSSGVNSYDLTFATGNLKINGGTDIYGSSAILNDQLTHTAGDYTKVNVNFSRQQYITDRLSFLFDFTGQLANKNLDSSEKLYLGGATGVRAYAQGEGSGDQGYLVKGEFHYSLSPLLQLATFIDSGHIMINKKPWSGAGVNSQTLSGAGLGLIVNNNKDYTIRLDYAWKIGSPTSISEPDHKGRWWLSGIQYF